MAENYSIIDDDGTVMMVVRNAVQALFGKFKCKSFSFGKIYLRGVNGLDCGEIDIVTSVSCLDNNTTTTTTTMIRTTISQWAGHTTRSID